MMSVEWRTVVGWPAYEVSDEGQVRRDGRILKAVPVQSGSKPSYKPLYVSLSKPGKIKKFKVAYLVLSTFVGPRPLGMLIRHHDDIQINNKLKNLSWGTSLQNRRDAQKNGQNGKLTEEQVKEIRLKFKRITEPGYLKSNTAALALEYGVSYGLIRMIIRNERW